MNPTELELVSLSEVQETEVEWLWYPYIPYGKLTIIQGDTGGGKTMLILRLSALLSKGEALPFDDNNIKREPINIIYQTAEDGYGDTIKPRLMSADADCNHIYYINEDKASLSMLDERIEEAIIKLKARLFILDPNQAYIGQNVDLNRANEVRPLLKKLGDIDLKHQCAIVLIGHLNKGNGKSTYKSIGSIDIPAAARSILFVGELKDDPETRVVVQDKNSLACKGESFAFKLSKDNGFSWAGKTNVTIDELLAGKTRQTEKSRATNFLSDLLADGPLPATEIYELAKVESIAERTLNSAKRDLNIKSIRQSDAWIWML
ncbi:AAA family ATPase [Longibaculum muris]|uniref:AAA family ATPase n=1 Tax=Longibaculum muris TaxID=1796628 RepID=UPI0012B978D0|nr:AAA family ATPase [Longibaculum muris]